MYIITKHIASKIAVVILLTALLLPSLVKFFHVFADHEHEVCVSNQKEHIHQIDLDCEFYKFKISSKFTFTIHNFESSLLGLQTKFIISQYHFVSDFQKLSFALRGPPFFV